MAYDSIALRRASQRLQRQRRDREEAQERRRRDLFRLSPELEQIDRQLRRTMVELMSSCLKAGSDPRPALRVLRDENMALQARQARILEGLGHPPDALESVPVCKKCGDTGWIAGEMCTCLRDLYIQEELRELAKDVDIEGQTFDTFSLEWYSPFPQAGRGRSPRENMEAVRDMCRMYAVRFGRFSVKNLFLTGDPGLGKTFLSACIARTVAEQGKWVVYVTAGKLFEDFREQSFSQNGEGRDETRRYLSCDLLVLDDLGSEWTIPSAQAALYTVVDGRLRAGKCTVISSNLDVEGLTATYSGQTVSRIRGEYRILEFFGEDIRTARKKQM